MALRRFDSLDGLRALSIVAVVWHHTAAVQFKGQWIGHAGAHGVTLFFAISGYLITTLLLRERVKSGGKIDLVAFYMRRSLRIFPLYYAVLALYAVLVFALERHSGVGKQFFQNLPYFATYTSNWFVELDGRVIFYFAWSLATEEQFYLLWPPLMVLLGRSDRFRFAALLLAVMVLVIAFIPSDLVAKLSLETWSSALSRVPLAIIGGVCLAICLHDVRLFSWVQWVLVGKWQSLVWLLLTAATLAMLALPDVIVHLAMVGLVGACVATPDHVLRHVLNFRPLAFIGSVSYGLYLLHMLAKNLVAKGLAMTGLALGGSYVEFVLTMTLGTALAAISYRFFETPFLAMKARYSR